MQITVLLHRIAGDTTSVPIAPLVDLFNSADVQLSLHELPASLASDPVTPQGYAAAVERILGGTAPSTGDPGNLFIGHQWTGPGDLRANGVLLDTARRGFASVFLWSSGLRNASQSALLRACAHEIGHMLNLTHGDGDRTVPTVECQAQIQDAFGDDFDSAWQRAQLPRPPTVEAFPFGAAERNWLGHSALDDVLPWGTPFRDAGADGSQDLSRPSIAVSLLPARDTFTVGTPIFFDLALTNTGSAPITVPARVHPALRNIRLVITDPLGNSHAHTPNLLVCAQGNIQLRPGATLTYSHLLAHASQKPVLPIPGRYRLHAALPMAGTRVPYVDIRARSPKAHDSLFRSPSFTSSLARGFLPRDKYSLAKVDRLLKQATRRRLPEISYLAFLRAQTHADPSLRGELLRVAGRQDSPRAVRHSALLHRAFLAMDRPSTSPDFYQRERDRLDPSTDAPVVEWLTTFLHRASKKETSP
jgi:hypothetical protein